jgi:hypothetical protein
MLVIHIEGHAIPELKTANGRLNNLRAGGSSATRSRKDTKIRGSWFYPFVGFVLLVVISPQIPTKKQVARSKRFFLPSLTLGGHEVR